MNASSTWPVFYYFTLWRAGRAGTHHLLPATPVTACQAPAT
ncbi:hypothetical protein [Streptomyces sp. NPDC049040]